VEPSDSSKAAIGAAAQQLIAAIDAKNVEDLERAGGEVEQACEQCHSQFWYPGDSRPK
jgi:cytochrome c556